MSRRLVIYTCIAGDYDTLLMPQRPEAGVDYYCYTDVKIADAGVWQLRPLPECVEDSLLASRYVKMHPHRLLAEHDLSVYVDANIHLLGDILPFAERAVDRGCLAMYRHPLRCSILEEAEECALLGYDFLPRIRSQIQRYVDEGLPPVHVLFEANILVRRHHDSRLVGAMELWWREFSRCVRRDQLSLPYALWKQDIEVVDLGLSDARFDQAHFVLTGRHKHSSVPAGRWLLRKLNRILQGFGR